MNTVEKSVRFMTSDIAILWDDKIYYQNVTGFACMSSLNDRKF